MARSFDAVVVGAGLIGLFAAWNLIRRGRKVLVAERGTVASGTTGASFAWLNGTSKTEPDYHRINAEGLARHLELARLWGERTMGMGGSGSLTWSEPRSAITLDELGAQARALKALDYPCIWLGRSELVALEPRFAFGEAAQGMFTPRDRWLEAPVLARHLAREITAAGGEVREGAPVSALDRDGTGAIRGLTVAGEAVSCGQVLLAVGPGTAQAIAMAGEAAAALVPVRRVPGLLVTLPGDAARTIVNHIVYAPDAGNFHIRPMSDGNLLLGDDVVDAMVGDGSDPALLPAATRALLEVAAGHLPDLKVDELMPHARAAVGVRPVPGDGRTIAGALPCVAGLFAVATHSGITLSPLLGEALATEMIDGIRDPLLAGFRPERFAGG
jgi:glycine/D-amino acid oxidase-like deaminating enzyme